MFSRFIEMLAPSPGETVLDVGVTSDRSYEASNYLEAWYPDKGAITAVGMDDAGFLRRLYPGLNFVQADGRRLPFRDGSFDVIHSSAVIEHVGSRLDQRRFVDELCRVARRGVFLTTPNRWFPAEFHTLLPFVHWLPQKQFHRVLKATGRAGFADEHVLNLLDRAALRGLCPNSGWRVRLTGLRLGGITSNLLLALDREA